MNKRLVANLEARLEQKIKTNDSRFNSCSQTLLYEIRDIKEMIEFVESKKYAFLSFSEAKQSFDIFRMNNGRICERG